MHDLGALGVHLLGVELFLLLAQRVQLAEGLVRSGFRLGKQALGLGLAAAAGVLLCLFHLRAEFTRLARVFLALGIETVDLRFLLFELLSLLLQLREHIFKMDALAVHLRLGLFDDGLRKPQSLRNGKGI